MPELVVTGTGSVAGDSKQEKVSAFIEAALERFRMSDDAESEVRQRMLDDKKFYAGDQWDDAIKRERQQSKRPCLTVNKLKHPVRLVTNQARTTKPSIQINPVDSGSDPKTAEVYQGIVRNIETQSDAAVAYQRALEDAAVCGRGWIRVLPAYSDAVGVEDESAFQQEIRIKSVLNCFSVYPDPTRQEADYSDMTFLFQTQDLPRAEYTRLHPKSEMASLSLMMGTGDGLPGWANKESVRIAEYYYIETESVTICLVDIPKVNEPGVDRMVLEKPSDGFAPGITVIAEREIERRKLKWAKINAVEVLEGNDDLTEGRDMAGQWIPFIPVLGEEINIDGKTDLLGVVRDAQDSARFYNVQVTSLAEMIGLAPKAPFIGVEGSFKGHETKWNQANVRNFAYLEHAAVSHNGQLAPAPQRQMFDAPIQAIVVSIQQADNDIKTQTMFQDASLGERGPQESGKAILARQRQGELGSSHYMDNLGRAIRHTGRICVNLIPQIYAKPRILRIIGADDTEKTVLIHNQQAPGDLAQVPGAADLGVENVYDIGVGRFDVTVSIGPSSETQRQEGSEMMIAAMQANPALFPVIGDLAFGMMDFKGAAKIAERLKKMLPPQLQDQQGKGPDPQQLQAQVAQMQQAGQQLQQAYQQAVQALDSKQAEADATVKQKQIDAQTAVAQKQAEIQSRERQAQLEAETRVRIAELQANTELVKAQAELKGEQSMAILQAEIAELARKLEFKREIAVLGTEHARADVQAERDRDAAAEQAASAPAE